MPASPRIYYPSQFTGVDIPTDLQQMAVTADSYLPVVMWNYKSGPDTITAPVAYAYAPSGFEDRVFVNTPAGVNSSSGAAIQVFFIGAIKASAAATISIALFINVNGAGAVQLKRPTIGGAPAVQEYSGAFTASATYAPMYSTRSGISSLGNGATDASVAINTGLIVEPMMLMRMPRSSSIEIGVKYKASTGNVTVKDRTLGVRVLPDRAF
jgi:hypothetical protein